MNTLVFLTARVPQIVKNYRTKSTGQLSSITCGMNLAGCVARIFTSLQEGAGNAMVRAFLLGLLLNGITMAQIILYRPKKQAAAQAEQKKKA